MVYTFRVFLQKKKKEILLRNPTTFWYKLYKMYSLYLYSTAPTMIRDIIKICIFKASLRRFIATTNAVVQIHLEGPR